MSRRQPNPRIPSKVLEVIFSDQDNKTDRVPVPEQPVGDRRHPVKISCPEVENAEPVTMEFPPQFVLNDKPVIKAPDGTEVIFDVPRKKIESIIIRDKEKRTVKIMAKKDPIYPNRAREVEEIKFEPESEAKKSFKVKKCPEEERAKKPYKVLAIPDGEANPILLKFPCLPEDQTPEVIAENGDMIKIEPADEPNLKIIFTPSGEESKTYDSAALLDPRDKPTDGLDFTTLEDRKVCCVQLHLLVSSLKPRLFLSCEVLIEHIPR
jgi:hypothetical protein